MVNTNFPFGSTLEILETQILGRLVIGSFALGHVLGELESFFPIFLNSRGQFSVSVDTQKTRDPNFSGSVIGSFALGHIFGELEPYFPFFIMADAKFP